MAEKVIVDIQARDNASQAFDNVAKSADNMGKSVDDWTKKANNGLKSLTSAIDDNREGFVALWVWAGAVFVWVWAVVQEWIKKFSDFEKTMSAVKAVLWPTAEEFKKLNDQAIDLGWSTKYSAQQVAEMQEMLAKNWLNSQQILGWTTDAILALAAATDANLSQAADIGTSAMLVFGKTAWDLWEVVNNITWVTNASKFGINDYALALAQWWWAAKAAWVSFEDFNLAITAVSSSFSSWSDAGTSLKTMFTRLVPASNAAYDAMKEVWIITKDWANQFYNADGSIKSFAQVSDVLRKSLWWLSDQQKIATLSTIFWSDAMRAASAISEVSSDKLLEYQKTLWNTSAADIAAERMNNLAGSAELFGWAMDKLSLVIWSAFAPALKSIYDTITPIIWYFWDFAEKNQTLTALILTLTLVFSWLIVVMITIGFLLPSLTAWFAALWTVIGLIWRPILAIIATLVLLYTARQTNFLWIQDIAKQLWDYMVQWWNAFTGFLTALRDWIIAWVSAFWEWLKMTFMAWVDLIVAVIWWFIWVVVWIFQAFYLLLTWEWQLAWDTILLIFTNIWTSIVAFVWPILESIRNAIVVVFTRVANWLKVTWDTIKKTIFDAITAVVNFFTGDGKKSIETWFNNMVSGLANITKSILNWVISVFEGMINFAIDGINKLVKAANAVSPIKISEVPRIALWRLAHWGIAWSWWRWWEATSMAWALGAFANKFAFGGVVQWPWWLDNVPAMLSPWELVLNRAQQWALASQLSNNGWNNISVSVSWNFYGDDKDFAQKIGDTIIKEFMTHYAWEWF